MTLTTEQLRSRAEALGLDFFIERRAGVWVKEWFNDGCTSATAEEVMMWSMLANREAQPALYASEETLAYAKEGEKRLVTWSEPMGDAVVPLFTVPPAQTSGVVSLPTEFISDEGVVVRLEQVMAALALVGVKYERRGDACRAAMLAQPVSSGYTLPDGWIACSERMPDADGAYWCWFGKEKSSVIQQRVCIWNDRNHEWCDSAVTHWMPLPAAQEGGNDYDTRR
ncbi:DUF551 domain-containing protein [Serratia nevei]|uniref:DUF551 domain-containing protein n=2 Tax=Serratia nevei TaxID=2703794 RepID=UPI0025506C9F|nr:DUF551 domain-containing protein [Serratia nevei]MEC5816349.1 DUF551 domain-containing protein [Serratia nevei]MEC5843006.1 DUF551 domain-containing protein [Serratia nevei]MEC5848512.1 DUF551 domain-containing protein [Serratia nevei]MEC5870112.1 DUF551 domain-containing protein [Serratia nevei]MEC5902121.1 DUF551 domain-containing protein [Serratia nevei]